MTGNQAEQFVAEHYANQGWWVHIFKKGVDGQQPFDLIALTIDNVICADVKHSKIPRFTFMRIEENQKFALKYLADTTNYMVGFFIVFEDNIYWLPYLLYEELEKLGSKSVKIKDLLKIN